MKRAVSALMVLAALLLAGCGGPIAHVVVAVRDEDGSAVTNVEVGVGTLVRRIPGLGSSAIAQVEKRTDTNGYARLTIPSRRGDLYIGMQPTEGFYYDRGIELRMTHTRGRHWQPWGQTNVLVVRRIVNPIPMYARAFSDGALPVPDNGKPVGFDLMEADWVAPHGQGRIADFIFTVWWRFTGHDSFGHPTWEASMKLSFSNEGDGILEIPVPIFAPPRGSVFRMPREAPLHGYRAVLTWEGFRKEHYSPRIPEEMNYFFRVRTKEAGGNLATALYGKIHGPVQISIRPTKTTIKLAYYLNPTPNDRNTEFDPKRNLFKLESYQRVNDP
jgi:hypothetical protein